MQVLQLSRSNDRENMVMKLKNAYKTLIEMCEGRKEKEISLFDCYQESLKEKKVSDQKQSGRFRQKKYEDITKKQENQIDD